MSPIMIQIGLWYHCRVGDYGRFNGDNNFDSPAVQAALAEFAQAGLLEPTEEGHPNARYRGTPALAVWVDGLCRVPWPIQQWVIPESNTR